VRSFEEGCHGRRRIVAERAVQTADTDGCQDSYKRRQNAPREVRAARGRSFLTRMNPGCVHCRRFGLASIVLTAGEDAGSFVRIMF
jgi:hypothetical protein